MVYPKAEGGIYLYYTPLGIHKFFETTSPAENNGFSSTILLEETDRADRGPSNLRFNSQLFIFGL
jgi:hypothetical protein